MEAALGLIGDLFGIAAGAALVAALVLGGLAVCLLGRHNRWRAVPGPTALGFVAGYCLLPRDFAGFWPSASQAWQYLPYAALWAALLTSLVPSERFPKAALALAIGAIGLPALLLAPSWPVWSLEPASLRLVAAGYVLLVGLPLVPLANRLSGRVFTAGLVVTTVLLAVASGLLVSIRFGQLAAVAAGALLAGAVLQGVAGRANTRAGSLAMIYALLAGGLAWIATVEPEPPKSALLLVPLLPWTLWLVAAWQSKPGGSGGPATSPTLPHDE